MSDYIKRGDALKSICYDCNTRLDCKKNPCADYARLRDMPAADARENVHGHWIDTGSGEECSVCHEIQYGYDSERRFCASCGAIMSCGAVMDGGDEK